MRMQATGGTADLVMIVAAVTAVLMFVLHCLFAWAVYEDGLRSFGPKGTLIVSPLTWAFATLMLGPFLASAYWLMHHSTLRQRS